MHYFKLMPLCWTLCKTSAVPLTDIIWAFEAESFVGHAKLIVYVQEITGNILLFKPHK